MTTIAQIKAQVKAGFVSTMLKKIFCHARPEKDDTIKPYAADEKHNMANFKKNRFLTSFNRLTWKIIVTEPCQIIYDVAIKIILDAMICIQLSPG
jgi:hypothetical protein